MSETGDRLTDVQGTVKWFDHKKGYGFIVGPDGQDVFVHYSQIDGEGFRALRDGAAVKYDAMQGPRGWHATRVVRVEPEIKTRPVTGHARSPRR